MMKDKTLKELIELIEWCGCDMYHYTYWEKAIREIRNRIKEGRIVEK